MEQTMHELYFKNSSTIALPKVESEAGNLDLSAEIIQTENKVRTAEKIKYYLGIVYFIVLTFLTIKLVS
ncbi:hypothetical protein BMS3Abin04_01224 [bacterium BMS3Abin04]|nr:hypothetical protein BMS3Abin04_01224 [bacterium BMS3Abin04]